MFILNVFCDKIKYFLHAKSFLGKYKYNSYYSKCKKKIISKQIDFTSKGKYLNSTNYVSTYLNKKFKNFIVKINQLEFHN